MEYRFSDKIASLKPSAIREVLKATSVPGMIPFAAGNPAPDAFPVAEVQEIAADILKNRPIDALQYGVTEGYPELISLIKTRMKSITLFKTYLYIREYENFFIIRQPLLQSFILFE